MDTPLGSVLYITLGCAKNEVDTDRMRSLLTAAGYEEAFDPQDADIAIVNTCSFLASATSESIETTLELANEVQDGVRSCPIVMCGCVPSRYGDDLPDELPEVAAFVKADEEDGIVAVIDDVLGVEREIAAYIPQVKRTVEGAVAYVKISDGCNRFCSFCMIPYIRGRYHSRNAESIISEVGDLVAGGVREIVLIGQDLAYDGEMTHAGGVELHIVNESYGMKMVDGVNGGKVRSRYDWLIYKDWFEDAIRALPEIEVIDATEGGALIKGSKVRTLADVIKKECKKEFDFAAVLEETGPTFSAEEYTKVKEKMLHLDKEFVLLRGKATEGKKAQEDLMKLIRKHNTSAQKEEKCLKTIRKVNNVIAKQSAYNLLDTYITGMTTEKVQQINMLSEDADQNMLQTLAISGAVYTAMIEAIDELTPLLKESLAKL